MTYRSARRALFTVALAACLSTLSTGAAEAGALRWRESAPTGPRLPTTSRNVLAEIWARFVSAVGGAAGIIGADGYDGR